MSSNRFLCFQSVRLVVCLIGAAFPVAAQNHAHYTRSALRKMMREASTADQCRTLSNWFREEETAFRGKAEAENKAYERYKTMLVPAKYPTRADTARGLRDYYSYKANQMATAAVRYETQLSRLDPSYRSVRTVESLAAPALSQNERMLLDRIERIERQIGPPRAQ